MDFQQAFNTEVIPFGHVGSNTGHSPSIMRPYTALGTTELNGVKPVVVSCNHFRLQMPYTCSNHAPLLWPTPIRSPSHDRHTLGRHAAPSHSRDERGDSRISGLGERCRVHDDTSSPAQSATASPVQQAVTMPHCLRDCCTTSLWTPFQMRRVQFVPERPFRAHTGSDGTPGLELLVVLNPFSSCNRYCASCLDSSSSLQSILCTELLQSGLEMFRI